MLTPDRTGRSEGKDNRKAIEYQSKMVKLANYNKPIKWTIPQLYTSRIKSMEKKNILTSQLNETGRCCAEISSKNP